MMIRRARDHDVVVVLGRERTPISLAVFLALSLLFSLLLSLLSPLLSSFLLHANAAATLDRSDIASHGVKGAVSRYYYSQALNVVPLIYLGADFDTYDNGCFVLLDTQPQPFVYTVGMPSDIAYDLVWSIIKMEGVNDTGDYISEMRLWQFSFDFTGSPQPACTLGAVDNYHIVADTHEEFMMLAIEPYNEFVLALGANNVGVLAETPAVFKRYNSTQAWGTSVASFTPRGAAVHSNHWGVVIGLTPISRTSTRSQHSIILFRYTASTFTPVYTMTLPLSMITNTTSVVLQNTDDYSSKHECSVAIRTDGRVLIGIQIFNAVLDMRVDSATTPTRITLQSTRFNGKSIGYGRSVSWDDRGRAVVLANTMSLDYGSYTAASAIQIFALANNEKLSDLSIPLFQVPNFQQATPVFMLSSFAWAGVNPGTGPSDASTLVIMDTLGAMTALPPSGPGYYTSTTLNYDNTLTDSCPPGTNKLTSGIDPCDLCPSGTYNNVYNLSRACTPCPANALCMLGSIVPLYAEDQTSQVQLRQYPTSDNDGFDDVLMENVFAIHDGARCVRNSPLFWGLITAAAAVIIASTYFAVRHLVTNRAQRRKISQWFKFWCRRADLVREGETWIGGLMSVCVLVMAGLSIRFVVHYLDEYPIERAPNYEFACEDLLNAVFSSNLLSTSIPPPDQVVAAFTDLDNQDFHIQVDFMSAAATCDDARAYIVRSSITVLQVSTCELVREGVLRIGMDLPTHSSTSRFILNGVQIVGALKVYLTGSASRMLLDNGEYVRKELAYSDVFKKLNQTVQREVELQMTITRVVNETSPFDPNGDSEFAYIWAPTIFLDPDEVFIVESDFRLNTHEDFQLTITLTESAYWVYNKQDPVARTGGVAFKMLLFILTIVEVFALTFLFVKLFGPLFRFIYRCFKRLDLEELLDSDSSDDEATLVDVYGNEFKVRKRNDDDEEGEEERKRPRGEAPQQYVPHEHQVPVSARGVGSRNGQKTTLKVPIAFGSPKNQNGEPLRQSSVPGSNANDLMMTDFSATNLNTPGDAALSSEPGEGRPQQHQPQPPSSPPF